MGTVMKKYYFHLFYFLYYGSFAGFWNLINVYYEIGGCTGTQIGVITSVSLMIGMVITPLWGFIGDVTGKYKKLLGLSYLLTILTLGFYILHRGFTWYLLCAVVLEIVRAGASPLLDHEAINYAKHANTDFGKIRSFGSAGYICGNFLTTIVLTATGTYQSMIVIYILLVGVNLVMLPFCPKPELAQREAVNVQMAINTEEKKKSKSSHFWMNGRKQKEPNKNGPAIGKLVRNSDFRFIIFLACITCSMMSSASNMVGTHMVKTLHCNENLVSVYSLVSALPEMIMLGCVNQFVKKIGYRRMYLLSIGMLFLRTIGYAIAGNAVIFLLFSVLQCFTTGMHAVCNLQLIDHIADKDTKATALTIYYAAFALSRAVFGYLWGAIYQYFGSYTIFAVEAVVALVALGIAFRNRFLKQVDA